MRTARLSNRVGRALRGGSRGVTLIEVLVAMALVGIITAAFLGGLATASRAVLTADIRTTAESLARSQMESTKNAEYAPAPEEGEATYPTITDIPSGYSIWSFNREGEMVEGVLAIPWDGQNNEPVDNDVGLQRIKLVIKHDSRVIFSLEGYKVF